MKPAASVALTRIGAKNDQCTKCHKCETNCPMDIEVMRYAVFCGESMFSRVPDASKVALVWLVAALRRAHPTHTTAR